MKAKEREREVEAEKDGSAIAEMKKRTILMTLDRTKAQRTNLLEDAAKDERFDGKLQEAIVNAFRLADDLSELAKKYAELPQHPLLTSAITILVPLIIGITHGNPPNDVIDFLEFSGKVKKVN